MGEAVRFVPAFGSVQAIVGYLFFYLIVDAIGPMIVSVFADVGVHPDLTGLGLAALIWLLGFLTLVDAVNRQWRANPRRFRDHRQWLEYLRESGPSALVYVGYLLGTFVAGGVVFRFWPRFIRELTELVGAVSTLPDPSLSAGSVGWVLGVSLAIAVFGWSLDRALVGSIMRLRYRLASGR
ncbi:MAG: hypothetical protein ABEJ58_05345 [Halodesulfurarchaeum sp.]